MIINDLDGYYIVFDTKNWNTELDTLVNNRRLGSKGYIVAGRDSEFLTLNGVDKYRDILIF